jgi:hypothetical protein
MRRKLRIRNFLFFNLINIVVCVFIIVLVSYLHDDFDFFSKGQIIGFSISFGIFFIPQLYPFIRDINKTFICDISKITIIRHKIQIVINRDDIIDFRRVQGRWLYAEITIFLKNKNKIRISNLNDDFKAISRQLQDWNIKTRPFFNFFK